jgi:hypothetical protein
MVLRASISITAGTVYAVPLAAVEYVQLDASAALDTTGRFRYIQELAAVVDGTAFALSKPLADSFTQPDAVSVSALKSLADGFSMNDGSEAVDGSVYSIAKGIQNIAFMSDATTQSAAKALGDAATPLDVVAKSLSRPLADVFNLADDETVAALKGLSDSVTMQDTVATLLLFIRNFSDSATAADNNSFVFTPAVKAEQVTVADEDIIAYLKNIADGVAMNDGSEAVDGSQYSFAKGISNVTFVSESRSLIFETSSVESISVADAGLLSVQDYCDLTYFAQDYVGLSQSF